MSLNGCNSFVDTSECDNINQSFLSRFVFLFSICVLFLEFTAADIWLINILLNETHAIQFPQWIFKWMQHIYQIYQRCLCPCCCNKYHHLFLKGSERNRYEWLFCCSFWLIIGKCCQREMIDRLKRDAGWDSQ